MNIKSLKAFLKRQRKIIVVTSMLVLGMVSGVVIAAYFPLLTTYFFANSNTTVQRLKPNNEVEEKKQALAKFYNQASTAYDKQDWASVYKYESKLVRENLTEAEYVAYNSKRIRIKLIDGRTGSIDESEFDPALMTKLDQDSSKTIVNSIEVTGNSGTVNRTRVICFAKDCLGENRKEDNAQLLFEFVNNIWQKPDPKPSERALKAVNYAFYELNDKGKIDLIKQYSQGSNTSTLTLLNWALLLDEDLQSLISLETLNEKSKAERNRPVYNQVPAPVIQQEAPVVQQQTFPKSCTSNTLGTYTFTNCY